MTFEELFDSAAGLKLLDHLIKNKHKDFSLTELASESSVSYRTAQRVFPKFVEQGIVEETRKVGRATMYKVHLEKLRAKLEEKVPTPEVEEEQQELVEGYQ